MTKQVVIVPEPPEAPAAVPPNAAAPLLPYPSPRAAGAGRVVDGWVESMRTSSPTHAKAATALATANDRRVAATLAAAADCRVAWMVEHSSPLGKVGRLTRLC
ncbi:unnamed protein product [Urochloa humidicola]